MRLCNYTLSPTRINNAKPKGKLYKLTDGGGLFIEVSAAGLKTWRYQYRFGGVRPTRGREDRGCTSTSRINPPSRSRAFSVPSTAGSATGTAGGLIR